MLGKVQRARFSSWLQPVVGEASYLMYYDETHVAIASQLSSRQVLCLLLAYLPCSYLVTCLPDTDI